MDMQNIHLLINIHLWIYMDKNVAVSSLSKGRGNGSPEAYTALLYSP
jgi:hypothetical protein